MRYRFAPALLKCILDAGAYAEFKEEDDDDERHYGLV